MINPNWGKKVLVAISLAFAVLLPQVASAQIPSIVPKPTGSGVCKQLGLGECTVSAGDPKQGYCQQDQPSTSGGSPRRVECDYTFCDLMSILTNITQIIFATAGGAALLFFIYGAVNLIVSGGSPDKINKGKKIMLDSVFGLVVVLLAYQIIGIVMLSFLGESDTAQFSAGRYLFAWDNLVSECKTSELQKPPSQ